MLGQLLHCQHWPGQPSALVSGSHWSVLLYSVCVMCVCVCGERVCVCACACVCVCVCGLYSLGPMGGQLDQSVDRSVVVYRL